MITMSASNVIALVDNWKQHHQRKLQKVQTILGTSRSRNKQLIVACTRAQTLPELALVLPATGTGGDFPVCCIKLYIQKVLIMLWLPYGGLAFWALLTVLAMISPELCSYATEIVDGRDAPRWRPISYNKSLSIHMCNVNDANGTWLSIILWL